MSVFLSLKKQIKSFLKLQFTWFLKKVNHPFKRVNNEKIEKIKKKSASTLNFWNYMFRVN